LSSRDVGRLQVAVQNTALVGVMDTAGGGDNQTGSSTVIVTVSGHVLRQVATFNQPHAVKVITVMFAHFVNGNNPRMINTGGRFHFNAKPLPFHRVRQFAARNNFQRYQSVETDLPGFVHHAHPAAGDPFEDFIIPEDAARKRIERFLHRNLRRGAILGRMRFCRAFAQ
jgi:hypothetical protein